MADIFELEQRLKTEDPVGWARAQAWVKEEEEYERQWLARHPNVIDIRGRRGRLLGWLLPWGKQHDQGD
jgi:hypothetical protein